MYNLQLAENIIHYIRRILKYKRSNAPESAMFIVNPQSQQLAFGTLEHVSSSAKEEYVRIRTRIRAAAVKDLHDWGVNNLEKYYQMAGGPPPGIQNILHCIIKLADYLSVIKPSLAEKPYPRAACADFAAIVIALLLQKNVGFEVVSAEGPSGDGHIFVVLGRIPTSDLRNINTWGNEAIIIDAWSKFGCAPVGLINKNIGEYPFFDYRFRMPWKWKIDFVFPFPNAGEIARYFQIYETELESIKKDLFPLLSAFQTILYMKRRIHHLFCRCVVFRLIQYQHYIL